MAIVVLALWLFTAGAGFYLLVTSSLGHGRAARSVGASPPQAPLNQPAAATPASAATSATLASAAPAASSASAATAATSGSAAASASVAGPASAAAAARAVGTPASAATPSRRAARRAARDRWDPPSLVAAKQAPILPSARSLVEFAHPAGGIIGLGFWLGFTLVHNRTLGWIGFGLAAATACVGLGWFAANTRAARHADPGRPAPSFAGRLAALHGSAATLTLALAALTALVIRH
jgi:hypothetical protein